MLAIDHALLGLQGAQDKLDTAATRLARTGLPSSGEQPPDVVNLSEEAVNLIQAANEYKMNLRVLKTADELTVQTIDLLA